MPAGFNAFSIRLFRGPGNAFSHLASSCCKYHYIDKDPGIDTYPGSHADDNCLAAFDVPLYDRGLA